MPDAVVIGVAEERLTNDDVAAGFILDGFPRTRAQAEALDSLLDRLGNRLERCIALGVDGEALVARLTERGRIAGRSDDNEESIRTRMQVYRDQTEPLVAYYTERGILVEIDGAGSMDEVEKRIEGAL